MSEVPEELVARLRRVPRRQLAGLFARQCHPKRPLDEPPPIVAYADRWQEVGDEGVLFCCRTAGAAWAEWLRRLRRMDSDVLIEGERQFGWIRIDLDDCIDVSDSVVQQMLGVTDADLTGDDKTWCGAILAAARILGVDAVIAPSAALAGDHTIMVLPHARKCVVVEVCDRMLPPDEA